MICVACGARKFIGLQSRSTFAVDACLTVQAHHRGGVGLVGVTKRSLVRSDMYRVYKGNEADR